jgi:cold shock CspA family protein
MHDKNFGFLQSDTGEKLFFHKSGLVHEREWERLRSGTEVEFVIGHGPDGRRQAHELRRR